MPRHQAQGRVELNSVKDEGLCVNEWGILFDVKVTCSQLPWNFKLFRSILQSWEPLVCSLANDDVKLKTVMSFPTLHCHTCRTNGLVICFTVNRGNFGHPGNFGHLFKFSNFRLSLIIRCDSLWMIMISAIYRLYSLCTIYCIGWNFKEWLFTKAESGLVP